MYKIYISERSEAVTTINPIRYYIAQSVRTNIKWMPYVLLLNLIVGLILVIVRAIPPIANLLPYFIINEFFIDIQLVKAAFIIVLLPMLGKSKTYLAWQEGNSDVPITKRSLQPQFISKPFYPLF